MKQTDHTIKINYKWWRNNEAEIIPEHIEALEETACHKIGQEMAQYFTIGELIDHIHMTDNDPEDGVYYRGYWEVEKTEQNI